jgi:flavodoxin
VSVDWQRKRVLVVYYSLTQQSARVAEAMTQALAARGCDVTFTACSSSCATSTSRSSA